jgi:hypothetical protein
MLWGMAVGVAQAATPLVFWWLDGVTIYALGLVLQPIGPGRRDLKADGRDVCVLATVPCGVDLVAEDNQHAESTRDSTYRDLHGVTHEDDDQEPW